MLQLTPMQGRMQFGGGSGESSQGGNPMLATAVGLGYLKQPLRYLTQEDIREMGTRAGGSRPSQQYESSNGFIRPDQTLQHTITLDRKTGQFYKLGKILFLL